jgi:hypothetical protein
MIYNNFKDGSWVVSIFTWPATSILLLLPATVLLVPSIGAGTSVSSLFGLSSWNKLLEDGQGDSTLSAV